MNETYIYIYMIMQIFSSWQSVPNNQAKQGKDANEGIIIDDILSIVKNIEQNIKTLNPGLIIGLHGSQEENIVNAVEPSVCQQNII